MCLHRRLRRPTDRILSRALAVYNGYQLNYRHGLREVLVRGVLKRSMPAPPVGEGRFPRWRSVIRTTDRPRRNSPVAYTGFHP